MQPFVDFLVKVLTTFDQDRKSRLDGIGALKKKLGEEEEEMIKATLEKLDKVWNYVMDIVGVLVKNMPDLASAAIEGSLLPLYAGKLQNFANKEDYELVDSICLLDDCMEHGPEPFFQKIASEALGKFIEIMYARGAENQSLTQSAIYGLGVIAQRTPPSETFKEGLAAICQAINWVY